MGDDKLEGLSANWRADFGNAPSCFGGKPLEGPTDVQNVERIRPRSKRKALNAAAFHERYLDEASAAEARGDHATAEKLRRKSTYWQTKCARWVRAYSRLIKEAR